MCFQPCSQKRRFRTHILTLCSTWPTGYYIPAVVTVTSYSWYSDLHECVSTTSQISNTGTYFPISTYTNVERDLEFFPPDSFWASLGIPNVTTCSPTQDGGAPTAQVPVMQLTITSAISPPSSLAPKLSPSSRSNSIASEMSTPTK